MSLRSGTRKQVERQVRELGWWYRHFELPSGIWTSDGEPAYGERPLAVNRGALPAELEGKTVLDVGGNSGYFTLQMKQRGAGRCVMVEPADMFVEQARFVFSQFDVEVEVVHETFTRTVLTTSERFDYVLFLGLFYHLKYGVLVLDRLAEMTKERIFFNSHIEGPPAEETGAATAVGETILARRASRSSRSSKGPTGATSRTGGFQLRGARAAGRSAGLKVLARPHPEMLVAEPGHYIGTAFRQSRVPALWQAGWMDLSRPCSVEAGQGPSSARGRAGEVVSI